MIRKPWSEATEQEIAAFGRVLWDAGDRDILCYRYPAEAAGDYLDVVSDAAIERDEPFVLMAGRPVAVDPEVVRAFVETALDDRLDMLEDRYAHPDCEPPDWPPGPKTKAAIENLVAAICEEYAPTIVDIVAEYETRPSEWRHLLEDDV